jgi:DNA repair protein RecO (recombination protein O)
MSFMVKSLKTEAIVLKKFDLLNKDVLISLFTQDLGRLTVFAKGIKKITSRRSPHLQTGNLINVLVSHKNDHYYLQESQLISGFSELKKDEDKVKQLYLYLFILDRLLPEGQKEECVYNLTKRFFIDLSRPLGKERSGLLYYLNKLMGLLGYLHEGKNFNELKFFIEEIINEKIPNS